MKTTELAVSQVCCRQQFASYAILDASNSEFAATGLFYPKEVDRLKKNVLKIVVALFGCWLVYQFYDAVYNLDLASMSVFSRTWITFLMAHFSIDMLEWSFSEGWYFRTICLAMVLVFFPLVTWLDERRFALNVSLTNEQKKFSLHFGFRHATLIVCLVTVLFPFVATLVMAEWAFIALYALRILTGIMLLEDLFTVQKASASAGSFHLRSLAKNA